ncbi:MAG: winged helix-turn-helix transcriptional regulator, partial [Gammaproteobacteria bacterium]|nr:winged helix-turn-helix transcriptional regulator [Gammaproteobacteria bacterium]
MSQSRSTREVIREFIEERGSATSTDLAEHLGITRQAVSLHLRQLVDAGKIFKTGSTRAARYFPLQAAVPA